MASSWIMTKRKYVIGITGGIGAGKSTVLDYITAHYNVETILADEIGRELMKPGKSVYYALLEVYGNAILNDSGAIDTKRLPSCFPVLMRKKKSTRSNIP